jgi:ribosomal protein S18 acetylase RimI-like enzyme
MGMGHNCLKILPISPSGGEIAGEAMVSPTRPISAVTTRPATQADYQFLYTLHKLALGPYVEATWGWDEASQGKRFRDAWEPTANQVVLLHGEPIGCLRVEDPDDHVFVHSIALLPEHQRHGLGASRLRQVQASAATRGLPVRLHVLKVNPARALYERLGFAVVGEDDVRWHMESPIGAGAGSLRTGADKERARLAYGPWS